MSSTDSQQAPANASGVNFFDFGEYPGYWPVKIAAHGDVDGDSLACRSGVVISRSRNLQDPNFDFFYRVQVQVGAGSGNIPAEFDWDFVTTDLAIVIESPFEIYSRQPSGHGMVEVSDRDSLCSAVPVGADALRYAPPHFQYPVGARVTVRGRDAMVVGHEPSGMLSLLLEGRSVARYHWLAIDGYLDRVLEPWREPSG